MRATNKYYNAYKTIVDNGYEDNPRHMFTLNWMTNDTEVAEAICVSYGVRVPRFWLRLF